MPAIRSCTEETLTLDDGAQLFYRVWRPAAPSKRGIVLFHRGHEHSGRWQDFIDRVALDDFWFFAWDARGHGRSEGERGYAESFGRLVKDADAFVRHVSATFNVALEEMAVVAQSVGAVVASTWVHDYAPPVRALVVATPAFRIKLYVPFAIPGLRLMRAAIGKFFIKSYVKPHMLTHDSEQARQYGADPLVSPQIAVNILLELHDTATRLIADAAAIQTPTLLLVSGADWVVETEPQFRFFNRLSSPRKAVEAYPGFYHSTFWEKERARPIARAREFILEAFARAPEAPSLLDSDRTGPSQALFEWLKIPLPLTSLSRWNFEFQRVVMDTIGRLSAGIATGWRTGFDSGESLDCVYRNRPDGVPPIGNWIDRLYLNSPGWRGIRQRKVHMQAMLDRGIEALAKKGESIRILDIASGPGRYVLDAIRKHDDKKIGATLCDRDQGGLEAGRLLAKSMGIADVDYRASDAFDADAIAAIDPRPNLAIVSGLYELFPSNAPLRRSLAGLGRAVRPGGFLIYTNQPWHPQHEMIARVLPNRDGEPWVMRCRSQVEMDQLVAAAGFRKIDMLIDDDGIFSVSLAVR